MSSKTQFCSVTVMGGLLYSSIHSFPVLGFTMISEINIEGTGVGVGVGVNVAVDRGVGVNVGVRVEVGVGDGG